MVIPGFQWFKRLLVCHGVFTIAGPTGDLLRIENTPAGREMFSTEYEPDGWYIVNEEPVQVSQAARTVEPVRERERKPVFGAVFKPRNQMMPLDSGSV